MYVFSAKRANMAAFVIIMAPWRGGAGEGRTIFPIPGLKGNSRRAMLK